MGTSQPDRRRAFLYLLNYTPPAWGTRDDLLEALCGGLMARSILPVLVFSNEPAASITDRYRSAGAVVNHCSYERGALHYLNEVQRLSATYHFDLAHVRYFRYADPVPWLARMAGIRRVVYTDAEGGELTPQPLKRWLLGARARVLAVPIQRFVAISQYVRRRLLGLGIAPERIVVIHNGVDMRRYAPDPEARGRLAREFPLKPNELVLVTVSDLLPIKQPQVIMQACGLLARKGIPFRLFLAGSGTLYQELDRMRRDLGIASQTHLLGRVPDPRTLLQAADCFLLATLGEAFGLVLVEAMACGVPVIASRSGGIPEVVEDGVSGLLFPPCDATALAAAIEKLAENRALQGELRRNALHRVRALFDVGTFVQKTLHLYDSL